MDFLSWAAPLWATLAPVVGAALPLVVALVVFKLAASFMEKAFAYAKDVAYAASVLGLAFLIARQADDPAVRQRVIDELNKLHAYIFVH